MAYMNQDRKAGIAAELKRVIPKSWKWSLAVRHHSTLVLTIASSPVDILGQLQVASAKRAKLRDGTDYLAGATHAEVHGWNVNVYDNDFDAETNAVFARIFAALNDGNHDHSDITTDYFNVGWYVNVKVGRWDKPFIVTSAVQPQAVAA